jgi:hypothetical protein
MSSAERPKQYITQLHKEYTGQDGQPVSEDITAGANYPESPFKQFMLHHQDATIPYVYAILPHPEDISTFVVFKDDGSATKETENARQISERYYKPESQHVTPTQPFVVGKIREGENLVIKVVEFRQSTITPIIEEASDLKTAAD